MEKYYDLIESLVKSHRKYSGCEDILEDIVNDVYEHAKVILNTVDNESVITSYLNKIVSTSMITVPRKMGITKKNNTVSSIDSILKSVQEVSQTEPVVNKDVAEVSVQEPVTELKFEEETAPELSIEADEQVEGEDNNLFMSDNEDDTEEILLDEYTESDLKEEPLQLGEVVEEEHDFEASEEFVEEPVLLDAEENFDEVNTVEEPIRDEIIYSSEPEVDKALVDKMINGVSEAADELSVEENDESADLFMDMPDSLDELASDNILDSMEAESNLDIVEELNEEIPAEAETEILPQTASDETDNENYSADEEDSLGSENIIDFYKRFEYIPEKSEINEKEVLEEISILDSKHPDKHIKDICRLKYQDNLSVSDIASKLELSVESVLDALNEIIYAIKD